MFIQARLTVELNEKIFGRTYFGGRVSNYKLADTHRIVNSAMPKQLIKQQFELIYSFGIVHIVRTHCPVLCAYKATLRLYRAAYRKA